jgi:hypothetical protein
MRPLRRIGGLLDVDSERATFEPNGVAPHWLVSGAAYDVSGRHNGCPTVRVYDDRMIALQERYGSGRVQIVAINPNNPYLSPADTYPEMVKRAKDAGYNFPYLQDENGRVARAYGAVSTPHAFVLDRDRRLRYRGRIDDSRDPSKVTSFDLDRALANVLENRPVKVLETQPFGCAIVR